MTAQTFRAVRWPVRAGLGLARSLILLAAGLLYPGAWALLGGLAWFAYRHVGGERRWSVIEIALIGGWLCVVLPAGPIAALHRFLVRRWTGTALPDGYRPRPPIVRMATGFWWNGHRYWQTRVQARWSRWVNRRLHDPARWRERWALLVVPFAAGPVAALPPLGLAAGIVALARPGWPERLLGLLPLALGTAAAPYAWRTATTIVVRLLRPAPAKLPSARATRSSTRAGRLSARVRELTAQRADATATQAAEIRRIERDLHDGAQARLAALGVTLATALKLLDTDPEQVRSLLQESLTTTSVALRELRELVRGINPPVLSERGLPDALRALALDTPLAVAVDADGPETSPTGRLDLPVETALYFGVSELLANIVKHARAGRADVLLRHHGDGLVVEVRDDGQGGARLTDGGGLAGLRRRLAVFDGTLTVDSPPGGPTSMRMEVPWTSS